MNPTQSNPGLEKSKAVVPRWPLNHYARKWLARLRHCIAIAGAAITLLAFGAARAASSGPAAGGNTLTINGTVLGNGSDITNVTLCGVPAAIQSQTANSVTAVVGSASDGGTGDINVYSASAGVTTFTNGYTYNPPGAISGPLANWSSISNLPASLQGLAAASVNGKIYSIGGYITAAVYVYDPAQPTLGWLSVSNLPAPRNYLAAASANGKIYAIGGNQGSGGGTAQSTVYVYDPSQPTLGWLSVSSLPATRWELAAASVRGKIYAIGGFDSNYVQQSTVYVYDPAQPALGWSSVSNLPVPLIGLAAATVNGKIYTIGAAGPGGVTSSSVYVYDPSQPALGWLSVSNLPQPLGNAEATSLNGRIYAIGGWNDPNAAGFIYQSTVYVYDPLQPTLGWLSATNLPQPLSYAAATSLNGRIYAFGGGSAAYLGSFANGLLPPSGPFLGGNTVAINGNNLGNGDVTNVTLCGIPATILVDNSPTQVVVSAGAAPTPVNGDVVVNSSGCGATVAINAYTYQPPAPQALPATEITLNGFYANWNSVSGVTNYILDVSTTSNFTTYVSGYNSLSVGNVTTFQVNVLSSLTIYYRVRCQQNGITSDNSATISVPTLSGVISASNGPSVGGNMLTITGMGLGNGLDITNVTICGVVAAIQSQTADSVTVVVGTVGHGTGDILVYSASVGVTTFANGYTYNLPGEINETFTGWKGLTNIQIRGANFGVANVNGKIYSIGGSSGSGDGSSVAVYDTTRPTSGWSNVSNLPMALEPPAASVNGKIYTLGGYTINGHSVYSNVYVYDPAQPALGWSSGPYLPTAGSGPAVSANGKIYAIEGPSAVYVYDPAQPTLGWLSVSNLPVGSHAGAATSMNGKIYALGSGVYVYDPSHPTLGWLSLSNLPATLSSSFGLSAVSLNEKIYVFSSNTTNTYVYDTLQPWLGWSSANSLPAADSYVAATSLNGSIYAFEGSWQGPPPADTPFVGSFVPGVVPSAGPLAGGNTVIISGNYLGNGDVTNVTLCGIPATILADNSPTQLVVTAGAALIPTNGDVVVNSINYGTTVASSAYTYFQLPTILTAFNGTNLQLSWPTNCLGWKLEAQTNPSGGGLGANWYPVTGSTTTNCLPIVISPTNGSAFFRLQQQ